MKTTTEKYKPERLIKIFDDYVANTELPILKEVCFENSLCYEHIVRLESKLDEEDRLRQSIKRLLFKKEIELEKGILTSKYNVTAGIFSLKQLGWRDWKDEPKSMIEKVIIVNDLGDLDENR
jgi:hypothetical protein